MLSCRGNGRTDCHLASARTEGIAFQILAEQHPTQGVALVRPVEPAELHVAVWLDHDFAHRGAPRLSAPPAACRPRQPTAARRTRTGPRSRTRPRCRIA